MTRQLLLDIGNRLTRIQVLGTNLGTVHDGVATIQLEGIIEFCQTFLGLAIAAVFNPAVGLHQDG